MGGCCVLSSFVVVADWKVEAGLILVGLVLGDLK